jgi:hypothetical protein
MNEIFRDDQFRVTRALLFDGGLNWSAINSNNNYRRGAIV